LFDRSEKAMGRNLRATVNNLLVRRQQRQQRQQCPLSALNNVNVVNNVRCQSRQPRQ
jgi:hypothetical protein